MALRETGGINTTEMQEKFRGRHAHTADVENVVAGIAEDRLPSGADEFYLTEADKKELGIRENEDYAWIRDDRYWGRKVPGNRYSQWRRENRAPDGSMPGRMITQDGEPFSNGTDLVLVARPKELTQIVRDREAAEQKEYEDAIAGAQETERMDEGDFNQSDLSAMKRLKMQNRRQNAQSGMIGGPSAGMPYERYVRLAGLSMADMDAEEMRYARGNRHGVESEEVPSPEPARNQQRDSGGKFYSLPPNVRPRNLAKT